MPNSRAAAAGPLPAQVGQVGEEVHRGIDDGRLEELRPPGLVLPGDPPREVVLRHPAIVSRTPTTASSAGGFRPRATA